jgi:hypothetical protein
MVMPSINPPILDETLNYKINRRVSLTMSSTVDGAVKREVVVRPVNAATERGLLYRQWVERNREYVEKISNGPPRLRSLVRHVFPPHSTSYTSISMLRTTRRTAS